MTEQLEQLDSEFSAMLTTYESYSVGQIMTELMWAGIQPVSKKIITARVVAEKSVQKRDEMLRKLQIKLAYDKVRQKNVPDLFYARPTLLNETDIDEITEEIRQKQRKLKLDSELRILKMVHKDLEGQFKDLQKQNQKLEHNLQQAKVRTEKVKQSYKKTINQYKSVLADHDLKLWQFLQVYVEYRYLQFKNLFKRVENKKQSPQQPEAHETISVEDLQRLKDRFER